MNELKRQKIKSIVEQTTQPAQTENRWRLIAIGLAVAFAAAIACVSVLE